MKIIDLAEKQRNNEILPKHIRYEGEDLYFDGVTYNDEQGNNDIFDIIAMNCSALTHLYDEIEIIEEVEDKEYEDIEEISYKPRKVQNTINALIRNQKKILEQLNNGANKND